MSNILTNLEGWDFKDHHIERVMDNASYTSAHPDDTLVVVGPPRFAQISANGDSPNSLRAVGMLQAYQCGAQKNVIPVRTIGSRRAFYLTDKASYQFQIGRLFVKGRNLLRALYQNAIDVYGVDISEKGMDETPGYKGDTSSPGYLINLDSELFSLPFGFGVYFRDKAHNVLGAYYMELCLINSFTVGINAGQNMVMENVSGVCDRLLAIDYSPTDVDNTQLTPRAQAWNEAIGITGTDAATGVTSFT